MPIPLAQPDGPRERRSPLCDGCIYVVEQFYHEWITMLQKQRDKAKSTDGSQRVPPRRAQPPHAPWREWPLPTLG